MSSTRFSLNIPWHSFGQAVQADSYYGGYYYTYGYRRTEPQEPPKGNEVSG